jgi:hypothetical protein
MLIKSCYQYALAQINANSITRVSRDLIVQDKAEKTKADGEN